jgi:hypothetical protein
MIPLANCQNHPPKLPFARWKNHAPSLKSINKTYIRKNKTNILINKIIIRTNITFIYTFLRGV